MSDSQPTITILSRPECHLCDIAKDRVARVAEEEGCIVETVDITTDPDLCRRYGERIPVVLLNGEEAFVYRVSERGLARMIRRGSVRRRFLPFRKQTGAA